MKTVKEITQETVDAFIETMSLTIFYEKVADELQMTAPEGYGFDCRKISISNKIQEQWIQQFEEKLGKEHLPELFRMLLLAGPKVEHQLKANELATEENWDSRSFCVKIYRNIEDAYFLHFKRLSIIKL